MPKIYFDVGANNGSSMIHHAKHSDDNIVYAFEPTPEMADIIRNETNHLKNYHLVQKAVSNYNGTASFYVAGNADWGCSSLNQFNDNLDKTWPGRTDFVVTNEIKVDVIRLDTFIQEHGITEIEYLHVDVQGQDLEVLMGLGDAINIVKGGVIEMPSCHERKLYKDQNYTKDDAVQFLQSQGFTISDISSNDMYNNEVNITFTK